MKLTKLIIENFRSFGPIPTTINIDDLTALIGANSSGKTTILNAIIKLLGDSKDIKKSDFHLLHNQTAEELDENYFKIEAKFDFTPLEDNKEGYAIPIYFENFVVSDPGGVPYIRILLEATWKQSYDPEGSIDYKIYYIACPESEDIENHLKPISSHDRSKIKVIYVPAVRNPSEQLKNATGTILWRILKQINWKKSDEKLIKSKIEALDAVIADQNGISKIKTIIAEQWKMYHYDHRYNNASIKFGSNELESILKKLEVEFTPTHTEKAFTVSDLGDGLKSLFYLSLVDSLLELENQAIEEIIKNVESENRVLNIDPPALTLVLVEEPENHVSPHLLGNVINNLKSLGSRENSQILLTSHSPSIIKRVDPSKVRHLRINKESSSTIVREILLPSKEDEAFKYVKEAVKAYPELYFSSLVILGEGDSEEILLPKFLSLLNGDLDASGVSVVPLGGRHVNHFWRLLHQLNIPFITLLDLDRERSGGGWGRIKYVLKQLIEMGVSKEKILKLQSGIVLTLEQLDQMHTWSLDETDIETLNNWCGFLEKYNVYFSNPLDIDFLMLESFLGNYIGIIKSNEGPRLKIDENLSVKIQDLSKEQQESNEYQQRLIKDIRKTLKEEGGNGDSYTEKQKELMIWYSYFFLGRGKPVTHIQAISNIDIEVLRESIPPVLKRLAGKAKMKIQKQKIYEGGIS
ncbi:ATP-dependent nuclease [Peribacillus frigoritolerans]|uniref:ATP-dependent nuclease n=1 Tax=Peribacillus frigoritolerans TaxID=450367 RepID=UPI0025A11385|nr:AAA family ATPase [Peribacillus frigoritolerans]MDM5311612.1 AAA family ATPase [Peribacillus frigoritolerans]